MIVVISKFQVKPDMVASFKNAIKPLTNSCRNESNCVDHRLYQDMQNETTWYTLGTWSGPESFHEHMTSPRFKEAVAKITDILTAEPEFSFCQEVD
jgi:quinol monooxygenase YgiN